MCQKSCLFNSFNPPNIDFFRAYSTVSKEESTLLEDFTESSAKDFSILVLLSGCILSFVFQLLSYNFL